MFSFQDFQPRQDLEIPLTLEEAINKLPDNDDDSDSFNVYDKSYSKYPHSSTL